MSTRPRHAAMTPAQLRALMVAAGIVTQRELADVVGVHRVTVTNWLNGVSPVSPPYAALIREKFATV